jgi:hypothetical protein
MKGYFVITASILMLATTAFGKGSKAVPTGIDQTAVYGTPADNGSQATWATRYGTDQKASSAILTSTTPNAGVVLTAGPRGGGMHGQMQAQGSPSGRSNWGHSFRARPGDRFSHRDFDRDRFSHRDFRRDHFFPRHRFFDRDDFFFRNRGFYPYRPYYYPYYYPYGSYYYPYYYGNPYDSYSYFYFSW